MKKHLFTFLFTITLYIYSAPAFSQDVLIDYTYLGSRTRIELVSVLFIYVDYDIDLYKIRYKTLDVNMQPDTASGLLVVPKVPADTKLPMVLYAHGTTTGPEDVPSKLKGGYEVAMGYAGFGFATIAPDYLGLGDSHGFHPYLHAASEASASLDMVFAGLEFLEFNDPDVDPQFLFLSGYSQGAHTSMALHKEIEENWSLVFPVTAATHMSGPYSISEVMRDRVLIDESYAFPSYIAYIFLGYQEAYHLYADIGEVFKEPYAADIREFYAGEIILSELNGRLISNLVATGGDTIVKRMLQDSIVDALSNDLSHPLSMALIDNDTYNWAPTAPTRLYYCGGDQQVPPRNSFIADSVMNALGADDVQLVTINASFDHGPCVFPSILSSKNFFKTFLVPSSVNDKNDLSEDLKIYPNPSFNDVFIEWPEATGGMNIQIINTIGEIIYNGHSSSGRINIDGISGGLYSVICSTGNETRMGRIVRI